MRRWLAAIAVVAVAAGCVESRRIRKVRMPQLRTGIHLPDHRVERTRYVLPNGLTVILVPDERTNLTRVTVRYEIGALEDPDDRAGLAHVVEHMVFELGPERPFLSDRLAAAALSYNATTTWDTTQFVSTALSGQVGDLLALEAERMGAQCEQLGETVLQRELDVVRSEIRQRAGVAAAADQLIRTAVYGADHPYARSVSGTEADVARVQLDDVCRFIETYYAPERAVVIVNGKFDPATVAAQIEAGFGAIPARDTPVRHHVPAVVLKGTDSEHTLPIRRATAFIVTPTSVFSDSQGMFDSVLATLLKADLVQQAEDVEYIADISVTGAGGPRAPLLAVGISVEDPKRLDAAVDWFFETRDGFRGRIDGSDVDVVKLIAITSMLQGMDSLFARDRLIGKYEQFGTPWLTLERALSLRNAILRSDVFDRSDKFFERAATHVVYLRPAEDEDAVGDRPSLAQVGARTYDIGEWRSKVDLTELDRDLELPARGVPLKTRRFQLDNGLRVILAPDMGVPLAEVRLVFPGGYLHEPDEHPGLAQATALLLDLDLEGHFWPEDRRFVQKALRASAPIVTDVDGTTTTFRSSGVASTVEATLWVMSFLLEQGRHSKKGLERLNEILGRELDEDERAARRQGLALRRALYGDGHPYANPGLERNQIKQITMLALKAFRDTFYRPRGATLVVAGKFDANEVDREIRELFGPWKDYGEPPDAPVTPPAKAAEGTRYFSLVHEDTAQLAIGMAFTTSRSKGKRLVAVELLGDVLRLRMSSLREQLASTYGISVSNLQRRGPGEILVFGEIDAERGAQAFEAMQKILQEVRAGENLDEAFLLARRGLLRRWLADAHDTVSVAERLTRAPTATAEDYEKVAERIAKTRLADVQKVIDEDLGSVVVVLIGPKQAIDAAYSAAGITEFETLE